MYLKKTCTKTSALSKHNIVRVRVCNKPESPINKMPKGKTL